MSVILGHPVWSQFYCTPTLLCSAVLKPGVRPAGKSSMQRKDGFCLYRRFHRGLFSLLQQNGERSVRKQAETGKYMQTTKPWHRKGVMGVIQALDVLLLCPHQISPGMGVRHSSASGRICSTQQWQGHLSSVSANGDSDPKPARLHGTLFH